MGNSPILSRLIDELFKIKRSHKFLLLILFIGLTLRSVAIANLGVTADDMHHVVHAINFLDSGRLITYDQSSGLWHCFTSLMYSLFGQGQLTSRLASLIFGTLSILLIYLLSKEFFSERISLFASLLLAISPFLVRNTYAEMDTMAMFFVLGAMLFFTRLIKNPRIATFILSGSFLGLAIYTKVYPLLFIPSLFIYFVYCTKRRNQKILTRQNLVWALCFLIPIFLFSIPAITHNYLLYKEKGFMDLQFSRVFLPDSELAATYYSWDPIWGKTNSWKGLIFGDPTKPTDQTPMIWKAISYFRVGDPVTFYLGILGLFSLFFRTQKDRRYLIFFIASIMFALPFLASIILLSKHFIFLSILTVPASAQGLDFLTRLFKSDKTLSVISIILLISLVFLGCPKGGLNAFYGESAVAKMIKLKDTQIPKNSLVIADSRIYRGRLNWMLAERPYLEGSQFIELFNQQGNLPGENVEETVYYVECVKDDCGWGTIKNQPEFNESMESLTTFFKQNGKVVSTISEPKSGETYLPFWNTPREEIYKVYSAKIPMKSSLLTIANQPKSWFMYTIGYQPVESQFDYYSPDGVFDKLLDKFAHQVRTLALILAICSIPFVFYITYKSKREKPKTNLNENFVNNNSSI